ncbi:Spectrin beta chain, non-erythrocytic 1, partial [Schistosoma japonicum]
TSQLAASHRLFKPPNGFSLNDLEESWQTLISTEHNCHLALLDELIRRENLDILGEKYERKIELCFNWLQENIQIINLATKTEDMKFIEEMNSIEEYFLQLPNEKLTELKQFPYYNLIVYRHQITSSRNKHSALITDTETYINLKMHKLHELFNLVIWIDSVQNLLNTLDTTDCQQFNDNQPKFYLQMNIVNSLKSIQLYYSFLEKKLMEISQWNTTVKSVYLLLNEINEELLWIKDQEDSIKPIEIVDNEFVENFNKVGMEMHHLQSKSRLLHNELQLRYRIKYFDHPFITLNQTLCNQLQQILIKLNVLDFIQLTIDDIQGMSIVKNAQQFNEIQEYNENEMTDLEKCPLIRIYEEILVTMQNMHEQSNITNVTLTDYYQSNEQVIYFLKIIELIKLLQRHWSKLLNEIKVIHNKLIQHNQYLNVLHNLVQINTKIDEANLRMCETYNSIQSTLMLTDYLDDIIEHNEHKQHEMNSDEEREQLSTVDEQTIVTDLLTEQKSLTVDKEIVINSTLRQMDHIVEQLKLFPSHLKQLRNESSDDNYEVSVTGPQFFCSSFQDDIVSVDSEFSLKDFKEEKKEEQTIDENRLSENNTINELSKVEQNDCEMALINTELTDNLKGLMSFSTNSFINNADDNLSSKHFTHDFQTPMNSPEAHEFNIFLLPHVSLIIYHLLKRLGFIYMHYTDWEKILLTFNPVIYPSMKFIASLSKPCPITITDDIIYATSQLSVQAYRFKTFENELINHANLRLSEIGMLNEGICEHLKKLDKVKDVGILQFIQYITNITDNIELNGDNQIKHSKLLEYINRKWQHLKFLLNSRHERFELVAILSKYHTLCHSTNQWIINKRQLLISTDDFGTDLNSIMQLQRRLLGWERDFIALQNEIHYLNVEGDRLLKLLEEEAPKRRDLYLISGELYASKEVNQLRLQLNKEWEILQMELQTRQDKLLASAELQQFFQGLDDNQLWLHNIEMRVATHQQPQSVEEAKAELDLHKELGEQILARKDEYSDLISYGRCITAGETDTHYIQLDQRLDRLENGWSELMQMWTYQQKLLQQDIKIQTFFRDTHSFEVLLSTQESKLMNYQLITLCLYATLLNDARALVDSTKDLIALREDMQKIQTLQEWLTEKKELIEEWDDAGKLVKTNSLIPYKVVISKRCAQHRVLENEIESNSERIKLVFQSVVNTIVQYPRIADQLSESLNSLMMQWEDLHKVMRERGDHMVQLHRAIIFDDGCDKLNCWLNKFFLKFITINSFNQFKQINEEYMEHNSTVIIEQLINELTSIEKLYENIEYSNEILKCLVENKFMNNNNNNWSNESKLVKGCTSMNEVNLYLNKIIEYLNELDAKKKLLVELHEHSIVLADLDNQSQKSEIELKMYNLIQKFWRIQILIYEHSEELKAQKHIYQLYSDLENERMWTHEKLQLANNTYIGRSLFAVNQLIRQHQLLIKEVANRTKRTEIALQDADNIITKFHSIIQVTLDETNQSFEKNENVTNQSNNDSMLIQLTTDAGVNYQIPKKILNDLYRTVTELRCDLDNLVDRMSKRTERLNIGYQCFTHLGEFAELRSWLQECEDLLLLESRASRDTITAKTELKKHANIEFRVNTLLANCVRDFNEKSLKLTNEFLERKEKYKNQLELIKTNENLENVAKQLTTIQNEKQIDQNQSKQWILHDEQMDRMKQISLESLINRRKLRSQIKQIRKRIQVIQSIQQILDRQYASLLDVCVQKRQRLEEILALNIVFEEVSGLKSWLNQQIIIASPTYTGRSLNECVRIINRFVNFGENLLGKSFTSFVESELRSFDPISTVYTMNITDQFVQTSGLATERTERVMNMCRCLIRTKHSDSPRIAFWQDIILETWADLRELICSRVRLLVSAAHRFIFVTRCSETLKLVQEKSDQLSQSIGKDVQSICKQLALLSAFEQDVQALEPLINWVERAADCLLPLYSGNWIKRLNKPRDNLLSLWYQLKDRTKLRRIRLKHAIALYRWLSNLDILFNWIQHCQKELESIEMDIWNINPQTTNRKFNVITTENIKFAISQTLHLRAELNARDDKVKSCLEEGKQLNMSFKQHLNQHIKLGYQQFHQPDETLQLLLSTEMESQYGINKRTDEIQVVKTNEQQEKPQNNTLRSSNGVVHKDHIIEKDNQLSKMKTTEPITCGHYDPSITNEIYSGKSDLSPLDQSALRNTIHVSDEDDQIAKDLQLRMTQLLISWYNLHKKWHQIYRRLELQLSINEFESVADSLEHWLVLHSSEVECSDMGNSIKETQMLTDRLNVLERNLLPQMNRYESVKKLTEFELADIEEGMHNQRISCVNSVRCSDMEDLQALLVYYGLNKTDASNDLVDSEQNAENSEMNLQDTVDSKEVCWRTMEEGQFSYDSISDYLMRKHEWINHNCKSRDRSWYELYMVIDASMKQLLAYRNKSDYNKDNPLSNTFRGEIGLLVGENLLTASETKDYTKRPNTFRITVTSTGAQYLFQAQTNEVMRKWVDFIQNISHQTRSISGPTIITLSRPSEEFQNPLVIVDVPEKPTVSKKSTLTRILLSKTTNQISCVRRHSLVQDNDVTNNTVESFDSPQIRIRRFPSMRTMKAFSPRQVMRWLTFKYSSVSSASSTVSHQTPKLIRSNTSHNIQSEQIDQPTPLIRKSLTSGSLHKISRFSISSRSHKEAS